MLFINLQGKTTRRLLHNFSVFAICLYVVGLSANDNLTEVKIQFTQEERVYGRTIPNSTDSLSNVITKVSKEDRSLSGFPIDTLPENELTNELPDSSLLADSDKSFQRDQENEVFVPFWLYLMAPSQPSNKDPMPMNKKIDDKVLEILGWPTQGGLIYAQTVPGAKVSLNSIFSRVSSNGWFVYGFQMDALPRHQLTVLYPDGRWLVKEINIEQREYESQDLSAIQLKLSGVTYERLFEHDIDDPTCISEEELIRIVRVPLSLYRNKEGWSCINKADLIRIREDFSSLRHTLSIDHFREDFLSGFQWSTRGTVSTVYGSQRKLNNEPSLPHFEIDIIAPEGTAVVAPADGVVTLVNPDMFFSGGTMVVDHGHGLMSTFRHLSKIVVNIGDYVNRGDLIAKVGATGEVAHSQLDWRVSWFGDYLDPAILAGPMP